MEGCALCINWEKLTIVWESGKIWKRGGRGMIERNLRELLERRERELAALHKELAGIEGGRLNIRKKNGAVYFVERTEGIQKGITKDAGRVRALARKAWLEERVKVIEEEVEIMREACDRIDGIDSDGVLRVSEWMTAAGLESFERSDLELEWWRNRHSKNPKYREYLRFETNGGLLTRSKSERYIGNFLEDKGVTFMYEAEIVIDGHPKYPDFTILCPDGRVVIWEHCGMMDKVEYYLTTMLRKFDFRKIGYWQNENLICTYDEDLDSVEILEMIYKRYIL